MFAPRIALLWKEDCTGIIAESDPVTHKPQIGIHDSRTERPVYHQFFNTRLQRIAFNRCIQNSVENGWRVGYLGARPANLIPEAN